MEYIVKDVPLWKVTIWDKKFNNVNKEWQLKTKKYTYLLSDELDSIKRESGDVRILYTGKDIGYTTEALAKNNLCEGEIVAIPWGGIPTVKYYKGKFVTGDNRIATSFDINELSNKYLYYCMRANLHIISSFYRGASLKHPCMKDVLKMTISYPDIESQNMICRELDEIELIIKKKKKLLSLLDELVRARFSEAFGNCNEYRYETIALKEICTTITGGTPSTKISEYYNGNIPWISTVSLGSNHINGSTAKAYITQKAIENSSTKLIPPNNILFGTRVGVGKSSINDVEMCTNQDIVAIMGIDEKLFNKLYIKHVLDSYQQYFDSIKKGATILGITAEDLKKILIPKAPLTLQNQFADFVRETDKSRLVYYPPHHKTILYFHSLLIYCI